MSLQTDLRSLRRSLSRSPGRAVAVWACTAVWIAVSPAFLVLLGLLEWRSFPFPSSDRIVQVNAGTSLVPVLAASGRFQAISAFDAGWIVVEGPRGASTVFGAAVEDEFFEVFASRPLAGRIFAPGTGTADLGGVVLTESLGLRLFGDDPAPGAVLRAEGRELVVLGLVPDRPAFPPRAEMWVLRSSGIRPEGSFLPQGAALLGIVGRLADGTSLQAADAAARLAAREIEKRDSVLHGDVEVVTLETVYRRRSGGERGILGVSLAGLLAFVLLVYTSALGGFLVERRGELAIRAALGARRRELVRLLFFQVALFAVPGFLTGLPAAFVVLRKLSSFVPPSLAELIPPRLDVPSLALSLAGFLGVVAVSVSGVRLSAPRIGLGALFGTQRAETRRTRPRVRLRLAFVCGALSLAVALGAVTAVLRESLGNLQREPLGFEPAGAVTAVVRFVEPPPPEKLSKLLSQLGERIGSVPGVSAVAFSDALPFGSPGRYLELSTPERERAWLGRIQRIGGNYPGALRIRVLAGRSFAPLEEETGAPVALLDETGAREIFSSRSPLGRTILIEGQPVEVVGIVASAKLSSLDEPRRPQLYLPLLFRQRQGPAALVAVARLSEPVSESGFLAAATGAGASASQYRLVAEAVEASLSARRLAKNLVFLQWVAALVLVTLAAFGTFSWLLDLRSHELAVRLALGDTRAGIARRALGDALRVVAVAVLLGLAVYVPAVRLLRTLLFGVDVLSPGALAQAILGVAGVALGAAALAVRGALRRLSPDLLKSPGSSL